MGAPVVSEATVDGSTLNLVFDQNLDGMSVPTSEAFLGGGLASGAFG